MPWQAGPEDGRHAVRGEAGARHRLAFVDQRHIGLSAERACAIPDRPHLRLRTLADVFACARAEGVELRSDITEIQVRRPPADRGGRHAFVSGKKRQNTMNATVIAARPPATRASPSSSSTSPTSRPSWTNG